VYGLLMMFLGAKEKRGLDEGKRGSSSIKAALRIPLPRKYKEMSHALQTTIQEDSLAPAVEQV